MPGTKNATYDFPAPSRILRSDGDASAHIAVDGRRCARGTIPGGQDAATVRVGAVGRDAGAAHYCPQWALSTMGKAFIFKRQSTRRHFDHKEFAQGSATASVPMGSSCRMD